MAKLKPCPFCGAEAKPMGEIIRTPNPKTDAQTEAKLYRLVAELFKGGDT